MSKRAPKSGHLIHDNPAAADGMAMADDMSHAKLCLERLLDPEQHFDKTVGKALYQSALISFRRSVEGDARSMRRDAPGGGVVGKISRHGLHEVLAAGDAEVAERMYDLADGHVAHRRPLGSLREVNADVAADGSARVIGVWKAPDPSELVRFLGVAKRLLDVLLQQAGEAMEAKPAGSGE